jgi:hypothetical protein
LRAPSRPSEGHRGGEAAGVDGAEALGRPHEARRGERGLGVLELHDQRIVADELPVARPQRLLELARVGLGEAGAHPPGDGALEGPSDGGRGFSELGLPNDDVLFHARGDGGAGRQRGEALRSRSDDERLSIEERVRERADRKALGRGVEPEGGLVLRGGDVDDGVVEAKEPRDLLVGGHAAGLDEGDVSRDAELAQRRHHRHREILAVAIAALEHFGRRGGFEGARAEVKRHVPGPIAEPGERLLHLLGASGLRGDARLERRDVDGLGERAVDPRGIAARHRLPGRPGRPLHAGQLHGHVEPGEGEEREGRRGEIEGEALEAVAGPRLERAFTDDGGHQWE